MIETTTEIVTHRTLPIAAPRAMWEAMGWRTHTNSSVAVERPWSAHIDQYLAMAVTKGMTGADALAWAVEHDSKDKADATMKGAIRERTSAIIRLADAVATAARGECLGQLNEKIGQLTDALLQQVS